MTFPLQRLNEIFLDNCQNLLLSGLYRENYLPFLFFVSSPPLIFSKFGKFTQQENFREHSLNHPIHIVIIPNTDWLKNNCFKVQCQS